MNIEILTLVGAVLVTPIITLLTMWFRQNSDKDLRRDKRDDSFIKSLEDRITVLEQRLDQKEKEIREIRHELKNRDAEYLALYQEHTTLRAKYDVLQTDHNELKHQYDLTATELAKLQTTLKEAATLQATI